MSSTLAGKGRGDRTERRIPDEKDAEADLRRVLTSLDHGGDPFPAQISLAVDIARCSTSRRCGCRLLAVTA